MAKFQAGTRVIRIDTQKKGVISSVSDYIRGRQLYLVNWGDYESEELETELIEDCDISNVYERCKRGLFGSYAEFSQKNTSSKIKSSNNSTISSLKASKTLFRAYQFKPLLKYINSPSRRLLVADEVGLGKTIEAGHIMLEMKARRELRNALIICPKSLQEKWRGELIEKFGMFFKIYDTAKEFIKDIEDNDGKIRGILNYEKIRYSTSKQKKDSSKNKYNGIIDYLSDSDKKFSFILCDEAHKMRNDDTQTYKGAEILMSLADSVVFLTATPIMISTENLYNLLHLLDNSRYFNYQIFNARLQENAPFVRAITALNKYTPLKEISKNLSSEEIRTSFFNSEDEEIYTRTRTVDEVFEKDPIYQEIKERLNSEDNFENRARLQYLLNSMSVMNNIFSRTRKRDVTTDMSQAERKPQPIKVVLTEEEQIIYDKVIEEYIEDNSYTDYWGEERLTLGGALGLVQKKRQVASSVYAYLNKEEDLDNGFDGYSQFEDAKFEQLIKIIEEVFKHGTKKLIVFAIFRRTLKYLSIRLKKRGYNSLIIHGQIDNRSEILASFKNNPDNQILLSSEVGSEGLDMQFCNSMVNYDLPWNPMVVEQRIGRIDRFGQKSPVVNIYNLIVAGSIQEDIYMRLLDRIGIFRGTIGDMEAILDSPIAEGTNKSIQDVYNKLEHDLYTCKLTEEEIHRKIDEISLAYEKERQNIEELEEGLTNTLTNDAYFKDEIDRILHNNAYVTEEELKNYLESLIDKHLTTCNLVSCGDDVYEIKVPISEKKVFSNFLTTNQTDGEENALAFRRFKRSLDDMNRILVTFNQQKAYDDNSLVYLNIYHPIIQACLKYFSTHQDDTNKTFCYSLNSDDVLKAGTFYYLGIYQYVTSRAFQGVQKKSETLQPFVFDIEKCHLVTDENIVNRLFSLSQISGKEYNPAESLYTPDVISEMKLSFVEASTKERNTRKGELVRQAESERLHNEIQTKEYYSIRIENERRRLKDKEDTVEFLPIDSQERRILERDIKRDRGLMDSHIKELQEKLDIINEDANISVDCEPLSIALIKIL